MSPEVFFDTLSVPLPKGNSAEVTSLAQARRMNFRRLDHETVGISLNETTTETDLLDILSVFNEGNPLSFSLADLARDVRHPAFGLHARRTPYLTHPIFKRYHSETEIMRYLKRLEARDLSLTTSMIPLGSCTMKLNAAAEMFPITWPEFSRLHPFAPLAQARGYQTFFRNLSNGLPRSPASRQCRSNQMRAHKANTPGSWLSVPITKPQRCASKRLPNPNLRARDKSRQRGHGRP